MTLEFRAMSAPEEFSPWALGFVNAYPAAKETPEYYAERFHASSADKTLTFWSVFEDGRLVGGMQTLDLEMNYLGRFIKVGGVGQIWVDFLEKKRGIAKAIVERFLDRCRDQGENLALLYAFRPDFYHDMGFGYGTRQERYSFLPASLPAGPTPHSLTYLTEEDGDLLVAFRNAIAAQRHGHIKMYPAERARDFRAFGPKRHIVGYKEGGLLRGYLTYGFRGVSEDNFLKNNLVISDWLWDSPATLRRFVAFLRTQADQVHRVEFSTQEEGFHFLLEDVRDASDEIIPSVYHRTAAVGVGLMYRIVDVPGFLRDIAFREWGGGTAGDNAGGGTEIALRLTDTFRPGNAGVYRLSFAGGRLEARREANPGAPRNPGTEAGRTGGAIELSLDITDLSALLMGSVSLEALHRFGRAEVSPETAVPLLGRLFATERPTCLAEF